METVKIWLNSEATKLMNSSTSFELPNLFPLRFVLHARDQDSLSPLEE